ncbi:hypothetical protein DRW03_06390 [Corallococcus sp. H22C18031201]|nr:hypothetical protein DRW03_06390 [Corallococcus sp. H22C18031201]
MHYGPWQCRADLMEYCRDKCSGSGYALQGCIWLADVKMDYEGTVIRTGSRAAIPHCCCNYIEGTKEETAALRQKWENIRTGFRSRWAERFGEWPTEADGKAYPAHHIRDLGHGGNPTDWDNLLPMPAAIHKLLPRIYNQCYANSSDWTRIGVDYPYGD